MAEGQIYKIHSDFYYIDTGVETFECKVREVLKNAKKKFLVGVLWNSMTAILKKLFPEKIS